MGLITGLTTYARSYEARFYYILGGSLFFIGYHCFMAEPGTIPMPKLRGSSYYRLAQENTGKPGVIRYFGEDKRDRTAVPLRRNA